MAVLETLSPKDLLTMQERLYLTDILRGQAVQILPAEQNWTIMTRENINVSELDHHDTRKHQRDATAREKN